MHPGDAAALGLTQGQYITITSRRGSMNARVQTGPSVSPGQIFVPMHDPAVNQLTLWHADPLSRQPSYKHCAVKIEAAASPG